ncbi:hypothetical protein [Streptomyces sp. NPDC058279]|uniref:hypothetical protein n=1 Tax=Streptomyces sp. NPDC058279 TaxID=3346418 RepID=UPI0036E0FEA4
MRFGMGPPESRVTGCPPQQQPRSNQLQHPDRLVPAVYSQSRTGFAFLALITIAALFIKPNRVLTENCRALLRAYTEACQRLRHDEITSAPSHGLNVM